MSKQNQSQNQPYNRKENRFSMTAAVRLCTGLLFGKRISAPVKGRDVSVVSLALSQQAEKCVEVGSRCFSHSLKSLTTIPFPGFRISFLEAEGFSNCLKPGA